MTSTNLRRHLSARHIRFMALGSAIGTGLFYGSASAIKLAGPSVLLAYLIGGAAIYLMMRALGEMAVHNPVSGSFGHYASQYLGRYWGFLTGWSYAFSMLVVCLADITAFGVYMGFWFPDTPKWIWVLGIVLLIGALNLCSVKVFGEMEFWLSLLKVTAIVAMIMGGAWILFSGMQPGNSSVGGIGISNLWTNGGFFPNGISGLLASFTVVMFAFGGVEMIGITAGEARNPKKVLPQAINSVPIRILLFYVLTLLILMSIYPWNKVGSEGSPFVQIFSGLGVESAASILNIVVISAAVSAINSDIFSAGRIMYGMAETGQAPIGFSTLSRFGVPWMTVAVMSAGLILGIVLNYLMPDGLFIILASIVTFSIVWVWLMILLSQIAMRRKMGPVEVKALEYRVPLWPVGPFCAVAFMLFIFGTLFWFPESRTALYIGAAWLTILSVAYWLLIAKSSEVKVFNN